MAEYLVTGGLGFIGSHLCDALAAQGHHVRVLDDLSTGRLDNPLVRPALTRGDVADPEAVADVVTGVDGIFHLAAVASVARSLSAWVETHRINAGGTVTVLDAARAEAARRGQAVPVVYASSAAVYGEPEALPLAEPMRTHPLTPYGVDKLTSELHADIATRIHGVPTLGLRFFNIYGPRQDPASPYSGVISIFTDRVARGLDLHLFGGGDQVRDFVYVGDAVAALMGAMSLLRAGAMPASPDQPTVMNVCTGRPTTIRSLAEMVTKMIGGGSAIRIAEARPGDIPASVGDPATMRRMLGFAADTALAHGLETLRQPGR